MKRAQYFLTASGRMPEGLRFTPDSLLRNLIAAERPCLPQPAAGAAVPVRCPCVREDVPMTGDDLMNTTAALRDSSPASLRATPTKKPPPPSAAVRTSDPRCFPCGRSRRTGPTPQRVLSEGGHAVSAGGGGPAAPRLSHLPAGAGDGTCTVWWSEAAGGGAPASSGTCPMRRCIPSCGRCGT